MENEENEENVEKSKNELENGKIIESMKVNFKELENKSQSQKMLISDLSR